jgi:4-hydroxy-4-methyl-2-oxoglutarate aldolase
MNLKLVFAAPAIAILAAAGWVAAQPVGDPIVEGFRITEVASVADAMEQLYGLRSYMYHDVRPVFTTKFAGPAVTVHVRKEEHKLGPAGTQGMLDIIDKSPAGSVYVLQMDDGLDFGGIGGLMATAMKVRGFAGAVMDSSVRDVPQIKRIQFPVYSRGIVPSTSVGHYRFVGANIPITCAGVKVNPGDIVSADEDGVVVIPRAKAAEVLKKSQELDDIEHRTLPFIEKFKSIREAVAKFGRI